MIDRQLSLNDEVRYLKGVGPKRATSLGKLGIITVEDLLNHIPRKYIEQYTVEDISQLKSDEHNSCILKLNKFSIRSIGYKRKQLIAIFEDKLASIECLWFNVSSWLINGLRVGSYYVVEGVVKKTSRNKIQFIHPSISVFDQDNIAKADNQIQLIPIYNTTETLNQNFWYTIIKQAILKYVPLVQESLPNGYLNHYQLISIADAWESIHLPKNMEQVQQAKKRLVFEELFYHQLMLARTYFKNIQPERSIVFEKKKNLSDRFIKDLSFTLTSAQDRVIKDIFNDMTSSKQMNRLLQGDVGSGKTLVALISMLLAIENGYETIIMAPTEILARQHFKTISKLLENESDLRICLLTGGNDAPKRKNIEGITKGIFDIIIGTHALLQDNIRFHKIGLLIIDEQQRFGVLQRASIPVSIMHTSAENKKPDVLYLSATPIPRSLALTIYGDLDISIMNELPPNRKPVKTHLIQASEKVSLYRFISKLILQGRQIYIVCPLIKASEKVFLSDVENLFKDIKNKHLSQFEIGLIHGELKSSVKDQTMLDFKKGLIDVLIATTVIEVGVDIPNASIMIIENAERFGLSQLHQLRGRVGRGSNESFCYLVYYPPISQIAKSRLDTMVATNDGFIIAEKDLQLRGPGEFFGQEQSGLVIFKIADINKDKYILNQARQLAFRIISQDYYMQAADLGIIRKKYSLLFSEKEKLFSH